MIPILFLTLLMTLQNPVKGCWMVVC